MTHIYMRTLKKVNIIGRKLVTVEDVATLEGPFELVHKINRNIVMEIPETSKKNKNFLLSVLEVIHSINQEGGDLIIHNLGDNDIIICYKTKPEKQENRVFTFIKVTFVALVLFAGSIVAIMTFQVDTQLSAVFSKFYFMVLGDNSLQPYLIEIPYAVGLAIGIIVFFNHFTKLKLTDDPTPIEVELSVYQNQVEESIIATLTEESKKEVKK